MSLWGDELRGTGRSAYSFFYRFCFFCALSLGSVVWGTGALEIVSESTSAVCEELHLARDLKVYKDPSVFLGNLNLVFMDESSGWEVLSVENPLLTTVKGTLHLMRLGPPRDFKNFGAMASFYELAEPKLRPRAVPSRMRSENSQIIPVRICGDKEAYSDSLGFILASELEKAQNAEDGEDQLPPSTPGNPIPKLKPKGLAGQIGKAGG